MILFFILPVLTIPAFPLLGKSPQMAAPPSTAAALIDDIVSQGKALQEAHDELARQKIIASATSLILALENPGETLARIGWGEVSLSVHFYQHSLDRPALELIDFIISVLWHHSKENMARSRLEMLLYGLHLNSVYSPNWEVRGS